MPLLTLGSDSTYSSTGRRYLIEGMPVFNEADEFIITDVDGWEDPAAPDAVFVLNGGGAGAVATGSWLPKERLITVSGAITSEGTQQAAMRRLILAGLPADREVSFVGYANGDVDMQMFVRRYDKPTFVRLPTYMEFVVPLIAVDPYKYGLTPLVGTMGVWTGEDWYEALTDFSGVWSTPMGLSGGQWSETLIQDVPTGPYPVSLTLDSDGDVSSQRVTFSITGPLDAGDWFLYSETTGAQFWVEAAVSSDQTLLVDGFNKTATLSGSDVTYLSYGDWPTLEPGPNSFRLVAGASSDAFAQVSALPAYE